jgi:hypothetical protein
MNNALQRNGAEKASAWMWMSSRPPTLRHDDNERCTPLSVPRELVCRCRPLRMQERAALRCTHRSRNEGRASDNRHALVAPGATIADHDVADKKPCGGLWHKRRSNFAHRGGLVG